MPVDPRLSAYLAEPRNAVRRPPPHVPIEKVRRAANAAMIGLAGPSLAKVADLAAEAEGRAIPLRLYQPDGEPVLPLILFAHGGGWVWGDLETHEAICRQLALAAGAVVLAVDYRLAPEATALDQVDDVFSALRWAFASAARLGIDPARVALCGDSAGATLALAAALRAREAGFALAHLAMIYPPLDPGCDALSQQSFAEGYMLTRDAMRWFWECHLGAVATQGGYTPPVGLSVERLRMLPPVSLSVAEFDVLRDEGVSFAARLADAGVAVRLRRHEGMVHGFLSLVPVAETAAAALAEIGADIATSFRNIRVEETAP